jgi:phenylpyruvate tautomerase PptA (4-oxalocrotonate tautomerase family)
MASQATAGGRDNAGVCGEHVHVFIAEFDHEHWSKAGVLAVDTQA